MRLRLPAVKLEKIVSACKALLAKHQPSVRDVAKVTGLLVSALPVVIYLEIHYRSLDLCKTQTLSGSLDYDTTLSLSSQARSDLQWVIENVTQCNGRLFQVPKIDIYIQSDASLIGCGAVSGSLSASGRWSQSESKRHINYLELLASFHALQCFVPNSRSIHVRLALDNSTAVAYINNMGGVRSPLLDSLSRSIWEWCKLRDIFISAQHIPGKANNQADTLSREISSNLEWSLNGEVFQDIISQTFTPEIDLFASRLNAKTAKLISWHPQPGAVATDAFSLSWANMNCYAFPPFSLLPGVLAKIRHDKALVLLIVPVWPTQSWYPLLLQLSTVQPILLPRVDNLLSLPHNPEQHPVDIICASWTAGTEKQYKGVWDKWSGWCHKRQIDLLQASVIQVVEFLTDCYHEGKGYSTINTYRSALSTTLCSMKDDRDSLGSHPLIARLLKGVYVLRPPTPRYSSTWDVSKVTDDLKTLAPLRELSLKWLTLKTAMLCALASAQRQQTLSALDLNFRKESQDSISFVVTDRLKTSRPGKSIEITFVLPFAHLLH
ncbi:uncharacterized protein [Montipora foliosa]|uniref:uncharacterized protein n=1 Tax=Montipora foliosa TaxID=591990 RepID=UPI0035F1B75B